jgi:hypothetical protein
LARAFENQTKEIRAQTAAERMRIFHAHNLPFYRNVVRKVSVFALKEVQKQYQKIDKLETNCSGVFTRTMGLPCAHSIREKHSTNISLQLNDFHELWHLTDTERLLQQEQEQATRTESTVQEASTISSQSPLVSLFQAVDDMHQVLAPHQQQEVRAALVKLTDNALRLDNPPAQRTRGRPRGSSSQQQWPTQHIAQFEASTQRDPSLFEVIEATTSIPRSCCRICKLHGHNARTCPQRPVYTGQ